VYDFGAYAPIRAEIFRTFDHALVVAEDDPLLDQFRDLASAGAARVVVVPRVGCESFAHLIYAMTVRELEDAGLSPRVRVVSVTVREHGANAATYEAA
jgi:6-pyruvoyltetrahydropterin/6-carboxytetrahydropterin synthase